MKDICDSLGLSKEEAIKAVENGMKMGLLHALGLDHTYMFDAKEQKAFRKEITDAIEQGVRKARQEPIQLQFDMPIPDWLKKEQNFWRRFELTVKDQIQLQELNEILERFRFSRRELAVIVSSLRLLPDFNLDDFKSDSDINDSVFSQYDP